MNRLSCGPGIILKFTISGNESGGVIVILGTSEMESSKNISSPFFYDTKEIASISIFTFLGSLDTSTVDRAGRDL